MFRDLTINLTERVCDCSTEDSPTCYMHVKNGEFSGVSIKCKSCEGSLFVPCSKLIVGFSYIEDLPPAKVINIVRDNDDE